MGRRLCVRGRGGMNRGYYTDNKLRFLSFFFGEKSSLMGLREV